MRYDIMAYGYDLMIEIYDDFNEIHGRMLETRAPSTPVCVPTYIHSAIHVVN